MAGTLRRLNILGVGFSVVDVSRALVEIEQWLERREPHYVCASNTHVVMEAQRNVALHAALNGSGLTLADGRPVMWTARLLRERGLDHVRGSDLLASVCGRSAENGWKHYLYGGPEGLAKAAAEALRKRYPGLEVVGALAHPFRELTPEEDADLVRTINDSGADVLWVGLGAPRQELWMAAHLGHIQAPAMVGVGGVFDILAGRKPEAPLWAQRMGLEWAFRVATDRRLLKRYAVSNPRYVFAAMTQVLGLRRPRSLGPNSPAP